MTIRTIAHKRLVVGEKKQRFGFRKTILGLCGAILGSTLLMADVANNAHTVHAAEVDADQAKSVQKGNNTANGLNGKVGQPLAKKEVPQLNSSLKQDEKAGADKNQGADKGATGTGADKSGSQLGSQTGAQGAGKGTQGTGTGADKGAQGNKSADVAGKYVPNQNQVTTHSKDTHSEVTGKTASTNATSTNEYSASASNLSKTGAASTSNSTAVKTNAKYANSVETVDNNKRGNRENTHFISQRRIINLRRIVKRSAVKTEATSPSRALPTVNEALTQVTKNNFLDYFSLKGSATYDKNTGIVTITPDDYNKVGNFSLKSKIDMNTSFTLTGQVNLGSNSPYGADGIGVAFHNGNTTDIGNAGGNLGIGGLQNALGFKLDTWTNTYKAPLSDKDGSQIDPTDSNGFGWNGDSMNAPYGTFVDTENEEVATKDGKKVQRWWAKDVDGTSQALSKDDVNGQFHDFTVDYDGDRDKRTLTIKYTPTDGKVLTWTTTVPNSDQEMAMIVSASTGGAKNLQQFKIISFGFKRAATVNVKYVDTKGNQIAKGKVTYPSGADVNGTYTTGQLEIPGYTFVRMDDGTATGAKSLPATGRLTKAGDNGTVIYVYA
ncbi:lectin-like domain-containing protein, partial [Lactobacillus helveticus]|uniref:lectin-like domain-containing protein n=1 Tax=Lactobacillus helveticus TaxID=1587 RepID=UPI0020B66F34